MTIRITKDPYEIIRTLGPDAMRDLVIELVKNWGHPRSCACIKVSDPFPGEDGEPAVLIGASDEPCDCGAEDRLSEIFDRVLAADARREHHPGR